MTGLSFLPLVMGLAALALGVLYVTHDPLVVAILVACWITVGIATKITLDRMFPETA